MSLLNAELDYTVRINDLLRECDVLSDRVPRDSPYCKLVLLVGVDGLRSMLAMPDDELAEVWPKVKLSELERDQIGKSFEAHFVSCDFCQEASTEGRRLERALTYRISSPRSSAIAQT